MASCPEKLLEALEELEEDLEVEHILKKIKTDLCARRKCCGLWRAVKGEGAGETGSPGNPDSTSHPLPSTVLPSTDTCDWFIEGLGFLLRLLALPI